MTNPNKTHIAVILDRSGSMTDIRSDMEGGFNQFIEDQRKQPGECTVSLYQFDDQYDVVYEGTDIRDVPALQLIPRGLTALLDAVGRTVVRVGERLAAMEEQDRPGRVVLIIITDGYENNSKEYKGPEGKQTVKEMVQHQEDKYSWEIVFLGADIDAFAEGGSLGVSGAKSMTYVKSAVGTACAFRSLSESVSNYRAGTCDSVSFTDEDRKAQEDAAKE